mgnify:CR=1 FL=1
MLKYCPQCNKELLTSNFNKAPKRSDGLRSQCKICETEYRRKIEQALRAAVLESFGNKCDKCGFSDKRALQIDHVNGGGNIELRIELRNTMKYLKKVLADKTGMYQLLCANCNWIKRAERNEHRKR